MKHIDDFTPDNAAYFQGESGNAVFHDLLHAIEQGIIVWNKNGLCEFVNPRYFTLLPNLKGVVFPGSTMDSLFEAGIKSGAYTTATLTELRKKFAREDSFTFLRKQPDGQIIQNFVRRRPCGGHITTALDVTEAETNKKEIARARARAEAAELRLTQEVERIKNENNEIEQNQAELKRLSLVAAHAKDLIMISDASNRIVWANEAFRRRNNLDLEMDLMGRSARDVLVGAQTSMDDLSVVDEAVRNRQTAVVEILCYKRVLEGEETDGSYWMEMEIIPVFDTTGAHTNFIIVGRDVTERRVAALKAEEAKRFEVSKRDESRLLSEFSEWLQSSDNLDELFRVVSSFLANLLPGSRGGVYVYGKTRDVLESACSWPEQGKGLTHFEPADCWGLRRGRSYFYGHNTVDFPCTHVHDDYGDKLPEVYYCMPIIAHGDTVGLLHLAVCDKAKGDRADTQKLAIFCAEQISLAIANVRLREQLREQSTLDPLTSLYNRRYFLDYARRELGRCGATDRPAALVSLDVDHFKHFNDTHGHDAGDEVLKTLAGILQSMFRTVDVPCRLGGEEFIVMLPGAGIERAMERAEALREEIEKTELRYGGEILKITASLGVAVFPDNGKTLQDLMQNADDALYLAKGDGRNCIRLAETT
ncbi:MAG: diguanylate cyclase [Pikeienuella sp.]